MHFQYLQMALRSDTGNVRPINEDAGCIVPAAGFCAVADGVGGAEAGDFASKLVIEKLLRATNGWQEQTVMSERLESLQQALLAAGQDIATVVRDQHLSGCGTTVILVLFDPHHPENAAVMHAGDSRAYRLRRGQLRQLTRDHTVANELEQTETSLPSYLSDMLTRAIGMPGAEEVELTAIDVQKDDIFLICTDGLYNTMPIEQISRLLQPHQTRSLNSVADRLMRLALSSKAKDNVTFGIIKVRDWDK